MFRPRIARWLARARQHPRLVAGVIGAGICNVVWFFVSDRVAGIGNDWLDARQGVVVALGRWMLDNMLVAGGLLFLLLLAVLLVWSWLETWPAEPARTDPDQDLRIRGGDAEAETPWSSLPAEPLMDLDGRSRGRASGIEDWTGATIARVRGGSTVDLRDVKRRLPGDKSERPE